MVDQIVDELLNGLDRTVPVIGEKEFFYKEEDGEKIPLQRFLVREMACRSAEKLSEEEESLMSDSGYYGLSLLKKRFPKNYLQDFRSIIGENIDRIVLSDALSAFLQATKPALIITTSPFDILERLLPAYNSFYYVGDRDYNEGVRHEEMSFKMGKNEKVIYHLFGKARLQTKWVYSEVELLQFLHWLHDKDSRPVELSRYLKDKSTLFLGCDFPDWLFRFLWYSISIDREDKFHPEETVGYWMDNSTIDNRFSDFLADIKYQPQDKVDEILLSVASRYGNRLAHNKPYDIFLSHAGEDDDLCRDIHVYLENNFHLNVYATYRETGISCIKEDNFYDQYIEGVRQSRFFMPIVTNNYVRKFTKEEELRNHGDKPDLVKETEFALSIKNSLYPEQPFALPVVKVGEEYAGWELNTHNIERMASGDLHWLEPAFFYQMQMYYYSPDDKSKDTFFLHDWARYKAINR